MYITKNEEEQIFGLTVIRKMSSFFLSNRKMSFKYTFYLQRACTKEFILKTRLKSLAFQKKKNNKSLAFLYLKLRIL